MCNLTEQGGVINFISEYIVSRVADTWGQNELGEGCGKGRVW